VQVHQTVRIGGKSLYHGLKGVPIVDLYCRTIGVEPVWRKTVADDDAALAHRFGEPGSVNRRPAGRQRDLRISHDFCIALAGPRHRAFRKRRRRYIENALGRPSRQLLNRLRHARTGDDFRTGDQPLERKPGVLPVFKAAEKSDKVAARFERLPWEIRLPGVA
jgi:hypothetical protein